jgi:hypothetical protein
LYYRAVGIFTADGLSAPHHLRPAKILLFVVPRKGWGLLRQRHVRGGSGILANKLRPRGLQLDIFAERSIAKIAAILEHTIPINRENGTISQFICLWIKGFYEAGTGFLECYFVNLPFIQAPYQVRHWLTNLKAMY